MKLEGYLMLFFCAFAGVVAAIYWFTSYDDGGGIMLVAYSLLGLLPGSYYLWWSKRMRMRAAENPRATLADGAGVVGAFPSSSIWPFVLGLAAALVVLALVFGFWTAIFGFTLAVTALLGVIAESRHAGASRPVHEDRPVHEARSSS